MKLVTYDGNEVVVTQEQAKKLAEVAGLVEITTASGSVYISTKNIASITQGGDEHTLKLLKEKGV